MRQPINRLNLTNLLSRYNISTDKPSFKQLSQSRNLHWQLFPTRWYQSWQRQVYDPLLLTQTAWSPQISGYSRHSLTSTSQSAPVHPACSHDSEHPSTTSHTAPTAQRQYRSQSRPQRPAEHTTETHSECCWRRLITQDLTP